jgi:hypothetical protein
MAWICLIPSPWGVGGNISQIGYYLKVDGYPMKHEKR